MPLIIPVSVNYPSPLTAVPSLMQDEPREGRKQVPVEILWGVMGGAAKSVFINLQNNATLNITQISSLKIDNSQSGADVVFIFPDTSDTVTIPAGTPFAVVPVFANATQVYVSSPNAQSTDVTRFQILNYQTNPSDVPLTTAAQTAGSGGTVVVGGGPATIQSIPAAVSGTLECLKLMISVPNGPAANTQTSLTIQDAAVPTPRVFLNAWNFAIPLGVTTIALTILDFNDMNGRFRNGLQFIFTPAGGAGAMIVNTFASYRQP